MRILPYPIVILGRGQTRQPKRERETSEREVGWLKWESGATVQVKRASESISPSRSGRWAARAGDAPGHGGGLLEPGLDDGWGDGQDGTAWRAAAPLSRAAPPIFH